MKHDKNHEPGLEIMRWAYLGFGVWFGLVFGLVCLFLGGVVFV